MIQIPYLGHIKEKWDPFDARSRPLAFFLEFLILASTKIVNSDRTNFDESQDGDPLKTNANLAFQRSKRVDFQMHYHILKMWLLTTEVKSPLSANFQWILPMYIIRNLASRHWPVLNIFWLPYIPKRGV